MNAMSNGVGMLAAAAQTSESARSSLAAAQALVPAVFMSSELQALCEDARADGENALWLSGLLDVANDPRAIPFLPREFFAHLSQAAARLSYGSLLPYLWGKAEGQPGRSWADLFAALVVLRRQLPAEDFTHGPALGPALARQLDELCDHLAALAEAPRLFATDPRESIVDALRAAGMETGGDPHGRLGAIFQRMDRVFDALFELLCTKTSEARYRGEELPPWLADSAWCVFDVGHFVLDLAPGLLVRLEPVVHWRAN
jgi:hypothetical protein